MLELQSVKLMFFFAPQAGKSLTVVRVQTCKKAKNEHTSLIPKPLREPFLPMEVFQCLHAAVHHQPNSNPG